MQYDWQCQRPPGLQKEANVVLVLFTLLSSMSFHCFVWKGKRLACGFLITDWRALEGFKENYHCWGDVTSSTAGLRCCRGWCEIHLFSYRWKWPRKWGTVFIPTREPETSRHHCSYPPTSSLDLTCCSAAMCLVALSPMWFGCATCKCRSCCLVHVCRQLGSRAQCHPALVCVTLPLPISQIHPWEAAVLSTLLGVT